MLDYFGDWSKDPLGFEKRIILQAINEDIQKSGIPLSQSQSKIFTQSAISADMSYLGTGLAIIGSPVQNNRVGRSLSTRELKSIKSLEKQIELHEKKIEDFQNNPSVRPGMENLSAEAIQKQQIARINKLSKEIQVFKDNIQKIKDGKVKF